jgi:hypothetical protein
MPTDAILTAIAIGVAGWIGTLIVIARSKLGGRAKVLLLIPSWVPWAALALGGPVLAGSIDLAGALNIAGAITLGMTVSLIAGGRGPRRK